MEGESDIFLLYHENTMQREKIAIIGMGCRFPGNSNNPDAFWNTLINGVDGISKVSDE